MFSHIMIGTNDRVFWRTPTGVFSVTLRSTGSLPPWAMAAPSASPASRPIRPMPGMPPGWPTAAATAKTRRACAKAPAVACTWHTCVTPTATRSAACTVCLAPDPKNGSVARIPVDGLARSDARATSAGLWATGRRRHHGPCAGRLLGQAVLHVFEVADQAVDVVEKDLPACARFGDEQSQSKALQCRIARPAAPSYAPRNKRSTPAGPYRLAGVRGAGRRAGRPGPVPVLQIVSCCSAA